jgi:hypothetical protein
MPTYMKKTIILLFVLASILAISSCKKENDKTWSKSMLIGTWEQTGGYDFIECPDGNNAKIVFTESNYTEYSTDEDGCVTDFGMSSSYTFNSRIVELVNATSYEINELTSTNLSIDIIFEGYKVGSATYIKI